MKKVVSATLAGALAVGMVPAMALAADDADSIELQTVESATAFQNGTIVAVDATGAAVDVTKAPEFTYKQGVAQYVLPTMVDIKVDGVSDVPVDGVNAIATYYTTADNGEEPVTPGVAGVPATLYPVKDANVNGSQLEEIVAQGTYWVKVEGGANTVYEGAKKWFSFEIVKPSLEDIKVYEVKADANDFSDMEFTYNGTNLSLALVADGDRVMKAHNDITSLGFCTDNGSGTYPAISAVKTKGNYAFMVTAEADDNFKAGTVYIPFSVQALDLSQAALSLNAQKAGIAFDAESAIAGITGTGLKANLDGTYFNLVPKTTADTITAYTTPGAYTYVLSADKDSTGANAAEVVANVLNKQDVVVDVVSNLVALSDVTYNGKALDAAKAFAGDLDNANTVLFDADLVAVKDGQNDVPFEIVVLDADGMPASIDDINTPGEWDVYVKADAEKSGYTYGGLVKIADVDFTGGAADADNVAFVHEGKIISNGYAVTYDGNDLLGEITPSVKTDGGKTLVAGTDYDVVVTNGLSKVVTEMVNADTYTITLKSTKYPNINNQKIRVVINPIVLASPTITNLVDFDETEAGVDEGFPYTGKAIVPAVKYLSSNLDGVTPSKDDVWTPIPTEIFDFGFTNAANVKSAEMVKEGTYAITMTLKSGNYKFEQLNDDGTVSLVASYTFPAAYDVVDEWLYVDVPSTAWFADEVRLATELKYMTGYYNGKNFGPYDSAERQDVAVVIGRMAGVELNPEAEGSTSNLEGFDTPFSDVAAGAYYARSVQWIDKAGIMTGYSANDEFGVNDDIKRQDLAVALYRYAQKYDRDFAAAKDVAGALAAYTDGAEVSGYAKAAVAWAIEQGIMGVGTTALNPADDITRAELAAMITRLQPEAL